jgi:hypothetical protein
VEEVVAHISAIDALERWTPPLSAEDELSEVARRRGTAMA